MVIIDVMIVNIALPSISKDLGATLSQLQWVAAGYTLTFASLLLSAGSLGDRFGAKAIFISGLALFALTSLGCGLASDLKWLITWRFFQGASASLLVPTSLALINAIYDTKKERARAIGIWASIGGLAGALGPILGAVLTTWFGWRAVFLVNIPIAIAAIWLTLQYVSYRAGSEEKGSFDLLGQTTGIISIAALAFSLIEAGSLGWSSEWVLGGFALFICTFIAFLIIERRAAFPMFPLSFFQSKTFSASIAVGTILNLAGYGFIFILPLFFQEVRGYSVLAAGMAMIPFTGVGIVGSYAGGRLTSHMGPRIPMMIGVGMCALGFFSMWLAMELSPSYWAILVPSTLIGLGASFTVPAATIAALHSVASERTGTASGAFNASRQVGSLLGVAIFGTLVNGAAHFISGMYICFAISGVILLCACYVAFACIRRSD